MALYREDQLVGTIVVFHTHADDDEKRQRLQSAKLPQSAGTGEVEAEVHGVEMKCGATTDSPMSWARSALAARTVESASFGDWIRSTHPPRYMFDERTASWFIPEDLRNVCWDRPQGDDLGRPHQFWRAHLRVGK